MKEIVVRVQKFLDEREKMSGIDPEEISNIQTGSDREAVLCVSDLRALLAAIRDRDDTPGAMLRNVVPHVRDTGHNVADKELSQAIKSQETAFAWSRTTWHAECPHCGADNELDEGDCVSGAAHLHSCSKCGRDFTFRAGI